MEKYIEVSKRLVNEIYHNSLQEALFYKDFSIWDDERIKYAFKSGKGTFKDFQRFMNDNKQYCYFIPISKINII